MDASKFAHSTYLKKQDVIARPVTLRIAAVCPSADPHGPKRLELVLDNHQRFGLHAGHIRELAAALGSETAHWIRCPVEFRFDPEITYRGEKVGGIRIAVPR